ncbi:penicillin-binding protein 2 [Clostridiaceae bacterium AM27-36LB]|nr:penicillin-binding protein 2 [Clostridiales bacterium AM23-16LB]RHR44379.1 penicillin-binding protein 2 [Clostridiaceae bacterium AF18-31LB]RHT84088.1 penicillin-binding protein 2 [Clostridiaceae bacterium AM27-36LB]
MSRHRRRLSRRQRGILKMKRKLALLFVVIVLLLMGIIVRLVYINRVSGEQYKKRVLAQQDTKSQTLPYKRGDIYDRNGTVLATSEKVYNLILDPGVLWKNYDEDAKKDCVEPTLSALVEYFDLDRSELNTIMQEKKDSHYVMLKKQLTKSEVQDFEEAMDDKDSRIEGVWLEDTYIRRYPYDSLACNVIGYTVSGNVGQYGIEQQYSDTLNGEDGRTYNYLNEDLEQEKNVRAAVDGDSVMSTIDVTLQEIVEKAIDDFQEKYTNNFREGEAGSKTAAAIMMDPNTGEILAMASNRKYDLNQPYDLVANGIATQEESDAMTEEERLDKLNELWRNFCVSDTYEPGSTAKPITVAAALESGVVHDGDTFLCDGRQNVGGHEIWCAKKIGHGVIDLEGSLKFSCNDALMQIAAKLGEEEYSKYQNLFNLGLRTGIDLPGEARTDSLIYYAKDLAPSDSLVMGATDLATNSFGQNFNVTMVQLISAFSATINGGYYYQPHVVKKIMDSNGGTVKNVEPILLRRPISSKTSALIRQYLYATMYGAQDANGNNATGRAARIAGYAMGGKTGTAEKIPRDKTNYLVSFIGFAPADSPQVVLYVVVDEPNAPKQSTSSFAQEIWKNIMKQALPYLNIYPTEEVPEDMKAEVEAEQAAAAEAAASEEESSEEESALPEGTVVDPQTGETVQMPDPDSVDQSDDSVLGDAPVNENLENVEPADATEDTADANPTE